MATSLTASIVATGDDARSPDTGGFTSTESSASVGVGNGAPNVSGYRFRGVAIPRGAVIESVTFSLVKQGTQWSQLVVDLAFEAGDNAQGFSASAPPLRRPLTATRATINDNMRRVDGTRYTLGSATTLAASLQEVVNRPGWQPGNSVAMIAYGAKTTTWARMTFYTYDAGATRAPQLIVSYQAPGASTPTATTIPASATPVPPTGTTAPPTATPASPTATSIPPAPTAIVPTPTATPSPSPARGNPNIPVGPGFSDVSPHQLVRTNDNVLYAIVPTCDSYPNCPANTLRVYRANQAGTPGGFTEQDSAHRPAGVGSSASAIDGNNHIHTLWLDRAGRVLYSIFDPGSNTWGLQEVIAPTGWTTFGQGNEGVALALDASGIAHAVWNALGGDGKLQLQYASRVGGNWTTPVRADDVALAANHNAWHPTVAFTADGRLVLAWLDGSFNYTPDGVIRVRVHQADGTWGNSATLPDTLMTGIDNGPSLLVTADGTWHLTFLDTGNAIRYWYNTGSGWQGDRQPARRVTHDPSLGPDGKGGVYIYGHGTPQGQIDGHGDDLFRMNLPAGGTTWGAWTRYISGAYDSSVSTRWSQFFYYYPETVDILYWADPYPNILYAGSE